MQPDDREYKALTAARLLGQLAARDLESADTRTWLCGELAGLCGARGAALFWPAGLEKSWESWGDLLDWETSEMSATSLIEVASQAMCSEQLVWVENIGSGREPRKQAACLPFSAGQKAAGVLLLWQPALEFQDELRELLGILLDGIAGQRDKALLLSRFRQACADLEKRRAELLRSRDTLRALFDNTPTRMYIVDSSHTLLAVNRCRSEIAGRRPQQLVGQGCFQALYGRSSPCPDCLVGDSLVAGRSTRRVAKQVAPGGQAVVLEISTFSVQQALGGKKQAIIFEEDVTERRRLEATLMQSEKLAAIGQLAAGVAHEINNPLTAIIANAQLLERSLAGRDEERSEMVNLILQAGMRASQVVQQLLDLSRQSRTGPLVTDVNESLHQTFSILKHELKTRSVRLEMDLAQDLPVLWANPDQLQSVWLNLVVNAMDAVQDGQGEIRVSARQFGETVEVRVADNGEGIPPERLARIFEPFYTTKDPGRGTGLGLSICQRVIKEHGGEIRVESQPGAGTCFQVVLPIASPS